jgi:hypothetical protein
MAEQSLYNDFAELIDTDAVCKFFNPIDRSYSESFQCRTTIDLLGGLWWFGISEVTIPIDQFKKIQQESVKTKLLTFIVRFETKEFSGFANVIRTVIQDEIITLFFNGLTSVEAAC